jgi:hypothetical protein
MLQKINKLNSVKYHNILTDLNLQSIVDLQYNNQIINTHLHKLLEPVIAKSIQVEKVHNIIPLTQRYESKNNVNTNSITPNKSTTGMNEEQNKIIEFVKDNIKNGKQTNLIIQGGPGIYFNKNVIV